MKLSAVVKQDLEKEIINDKNFILAIQLSRVVNGLRSNMRTILKVTNDESFIKAKDRIDLLMVHGALLYEAIKMFASNSQHFSKLEIFTTEKEQFKAIQKQNGDSKSFKNTILKKIRNKLFFHFDQDVVPDTLPKMQFPEGITFLMAASKNNIDTIYTLADDIILTYLTDYDESENVDSVAIYESIRDQIISLSGMLGNLIDKVITELLHDKLEIKKNNV